MSNQNGNTPPDGWPIYRLLTGPDDAAFCQRVSHAIEVGYVLVGSPAVTFDGKQVIAAQAVVWGPSGSSPARGDQCRRYSAAHIIVFDEGLA
jgi:hypothetical protein